MPDEDKEDYAVRAAREWLAERYGYTDGHNAICVACGADANQLAAIIRKHVDLMIEERHFQ